MKSSSSSKKDRNSRNWLSPWKKSKTTSAEIGQNHTTPTNPVSLTEDVAGITTSCNHGLENEVTSKSETKSLWNQAYDALKEKDRALVDKYELLVKQSLLPGTGKGLTNGDTTDRQICFEHISAEALKLKDNKGKISVFGRLISIQESLEKLAKGITFARDWISDAVKASPEASIAWSVVLLTLPLLTKPAEVDKANMDAFIYVSLRMRYYIAVEDLLFNSEIGLHAKAQAQPQAFLKDQVKDMYQKILDLEIRSVIRIQKSSFKMIMDDTFRHCEWNDKLEAIKALDEQIYQDSLQVASGDIRNHLSELRSEAIKHNLAIQRIQKEQLQLSKDQLAVSEAVLRNVEQWNKRELNREEKNCLQSFCLEPHYEFFKEQVEKHIKGTCRWFLEHERYQNWLTKTGGYLLVTADPGCGKSVLAKRLIDHELAKECPGTRIAYFFFKDQQQSKLSMALCALLHQLLDGSLIKHAMPKFEKNGQTLKSNVNALFDILCEIVHDPSTGSVVLVLDGLDECDDDDRHYLFRLLKHTKRSNKFKVLLTSRPYDSILTDFEEEGESLSTWVRIPGDKEAEAISEEINLVINHKLTKLADQKWNKLNHKTRDLLETALMKMEHRTYLWAFLIFDELEKDIKKGIREMKAYLDHFPRKIEDAYEKILNKTTDKYAKSQTLKVLQIMLGAARPLSSRELQIALLISAETGSHAELELELDDDHDFELKIRDWCGLMVQIYKNKVVFLHQTVRDFLLSSNSSVQAIMNLPSTRWSKSIDVQKANAILAYSCITYLHLAEFEFTWRDQDKILKRWFYDDTLRARFPFLTYSADHWDSHFEAGNCNQDRGLVTNAIALCKYTTGISRNLHRAQECRMWNWLGFGVYGKPTELHVAACLSTAGLAKIFLRTIDFNLTSIMEAVLVARRGSNKVTGNVLLDYAVGNGNNDPLLAKLLASAVWLKRTDIVTKLFELGISPEFSSEEDKTALCDVVLQNNVEMAKVLLSYGVDPNIGQRYSGGPLMLAVGNGNTEMVKVLLDHGADPNLDCDPPGRTILQCASDYAAENLYDEMVTILLNHGADPNIGDKNGWTALHHAMRPRHVKVVNMLLDHGADPNLAAGYDGYTALHLAVDEEFVEAVTILLDHQSNVDAQAKDGTTVLMIAALKGNLQIVNLLLQRGVDPTLEDDDYSAADDMAILSGHPSIAALLTKKVVRKRASLSELWPLKPFWELEQNDKDHPTTYNKTRRRPLPKEPRRHSFSGLIERLCSTEGNHSNF